MREMAAIQKALSRPSERQKLLSVMPTSFKILTAPSEPRILVSVLCSLFSVLKISICFKCQNLFLPHLIADQR